MFFNFQQTNKEFPLAPVGYFEARVGYILPQTYNLALKKSGQNRDKLLVCSQLVSLDFQPSQ